MFVPARKTMLGLVLVASLVFAVTPALADPSGGCVVGATTTCTFNYTGAPEAWVVPAGATSAVFDLFGGAGGNLAPSNPFGSPLPGGSGGKGAHVQATVALTPGATLTMRVGGKGTDGSVSPIPFTGTLTAAGGFNGGGTNSVTCSGACAFVLGGGGGGASDVRTSADGLANRLLVAGGGGGAGVGGLGTSDPGTGGDSASTAKSVTGGDDPFQMVTCSGGGAGTLLGPGAAGDVDCAPGQPGAAGGLTGGGNGGNIADLGAGGGGYFGGGAGAALGGSASGGGGGSDFPDPANPPMGVSNVTVTNGVQSGNGFITVTYATPTADLAITKTDGVVSAAAGGSVTYTITVSNAGPSDAAGAMVADAFPAALTATWTCVGAGGGTCAASGSGNISATVNLPVGGSVAYTVSAAIGSGASGTLSNTATVTPAAGVTDPAPGNNSATDTDTLVTAVTFASASATRTAKGVLLRWRTGTEAELLGFQVYRSRGHSWQRLTRSLIVAKGSVAGASYRLLDKTARRGVAYRYRIKAVNRDGTTSWLGPVRVTQASASRG